jgi:hypothetical protein
MLDTLRLYFEATVAVAIMAMFAIISGFASAGLTATAGWPSLSLPWRSCSQGSY